MVNHLLETGSVSDVENQQGTTGELVVAPGDGVEPFLASCIHDANFHFGAPLATLDVLHVNADGRGPLRIEFLFSGEYCEQTGFAYHTTAW